MHSLVVARVLDKQTCNSLTPESQPTLIDFLIVNGNMCDLLRDKAFAQFFQLITIAAVDQFKIPSLSQFGLVPNL